MEELSFERFDQQEEAEPIIEEILEETQKKERKKRIPRNYINNEHFCDALIKYNEECSKAVSEGKKKPQLPNYIGECFLKLADGLARKPNFYAYSFKDQMKSDAIENVLLYLHNFDPTKSRNAFAYFTQIMYFAFLRRIKREKIEQYVKYKSAEDFFILDEFDMYDSEEHKAISPTEIYDNMKDFIKKFEESEFKKKPIEEIVKIEEVKGIEEFL